MVDSEAVDALASALEAVDVKSRRSSDEGRPIDMVVVTPAGDEVTIEVKRVSTVALETASRLSRDLPHEDGQDVVPLLVADRITREARRLLTDRGWGWLDLRGHLYLSAPGLLLNTEIEPLRQRATRSDPLAGKAGLEVACLLLATPGERWSVRGAAREIGRSPSTVSEILSGLRDEDLLVGTHDVRHPDLFWRVADSWPYRRVFLVNSPDLGALASGPGSLNEVLGLGFGDLSSGTGWALTDTLAAATYGAPVSVRADHPSDWFVPSEATLKRARTLLGAAAEAGGAGASVRVAPVPEVCSGRVDPAEWSNEYRPLAAPLFVALDLAQDRGRGREVLSAWDPSTNGPGGGTRTSWGWQRVW